MRTSTKKNFIYNLSYQLLSQVLPFLTIPYVSRVLGAEDIGVYSYTYSIVHYFIIFAMMGLANYGNRTIAKVKDDKRKLAVTFKEIYYMQLLSSITMTLLYVAYLIIFDNTNQTIAIIQILHLISCIFDISWFFFGMEKFRLTTSINGVIKLLSLISIFIFVRNPGDLLSYTIILSGSTLISQVALWMFMPKDILKTKIKFSGIKKHIIPNLRLFLTTIGVMLFKIMDKTMLGIFSGMEEVGYYENAEKISQAPTTVLTALGVVMLPRMSNLYQNNDEKNAGATLEKSISFAMFASIAMAFGLIAIGQDFTTLFLGNGFQRSGILTQILSITIISLAWGNVLRTQYLIPKEYDKEYAISAFVGAGVNLIANLILIPRLAAIGACIGTVLAEISVVIYQTIVVHDKLPIKRYLFNTIPFLIKATIMLVATIILGMIIGEKVPLTIKLITQIITATSLYFILNLKYITTKLIPIKKYRQKH